MPAFGLLIFIGLIFRLLLVGNPGFEADISFWKSWSLAAIDHGIYWTSHNTNINYPPGFIYVLWIMGKVYSLMADPHKWDEFWQVNNFYFLLASKSIAMTSDVIITCLIYWFFSQKEKLKQLGAILHHETNSIQEANAKEIQQKTNTTLSSLKLFANNNIPLILAALFYLNPVVIIDSALWGQVESFGILFTILAILCIFYEYVSLAAALFTIGCLMKLQNIIYIPLFFLFICRFYNFKTFTKALVSAGITFLIVTLPFIINNDMNQVLYLLTINSDYFPWLSLNAHNLWWIVSGAKGMQVTDRITAIGTLTAKSVGLYLFAASYLYAMILIYLKPVARNLFYSLAFGIFAFFLLTTQSHERYSYPVVVFLLFLYPFLETQISRVKTTFPLHKFFWVLYFSVTAVIFFNIHTGLIVNYPHSGFESIAHFTTPAATLLNSYLHIILFLLLIPLSISQISPIYPFVSLGVFSLLLISGNASYLFGGKVSLTKYIPIIQKQDFSVVQVNQSVNSHSTWKNWNRLSDDYMFYRKGFGSHALSTLVFDIKGMYSKFSTDYGVDTEAATPASVTFNIYGDDKLLFASQKYGRFDFPGHTTVDIKGVKLLKLEITDAKDGINSDHADWLNPILYR